MPKEKYYRVGERPPPRGPVTKGLWKPPPRPTPDTATAPEPEPPQSRRRNTRRSLRPSADTARDRAD